MLVVGFIANEGIHIDSLPATFTGLPPDVISLLKSPPADLLTVSATENTSNTIISTTSSADAP